MKRIPRIALVAATLIGLMLASSAPGGYAGYGCWQCDDCGGQGMTGPTEWCCVDVGHEGEGLGIQCWDYNHGPLLGTLCTLGGGPCYQVWTSPGGPPCGTC